MIKDELKNKILECENNLAKIKQNFKKRDDTILCNNTNNKLKIFESMLNKIEIKYYGKLERQLQDIEQSIIILSNCEQEVNENTSF